MLRTPIQFDPERPNLERNTCGGCFFLAVSHDPSQGAEPSAPKNLLMSPTYALNA